MKNTVQAILSHRERTIPILSFPSTSLLNITVSELIGSADNQAKGMKAITERVSVGAALNMMDLSVEAEAFGAQIRFSENEIPTVTKGVLSAIEDVSSLAVPAVGKGRTGLYIEGVKKAKEQISDVPVFCGVIGPYSLAGRLFDMTELMMSCYDDPESVKLLLQKCSRFLSEYVKAFKEAGADGVIMAEPAAGLLSPDLCDEFSSPFVKEIFSEVGDENFVLCYHNCGGTVIDAAASLAGVGADMYHFGNAIDLSKIIPLLPADSIVMGNVDPVLFKNGTAKDIKEQTEKVFGACEKYKNFMLSSGCDIPFDAKWENIDMFFETVKELYEKRA